MIHLDEQELVTLVQVISTTISFHKRQLVIYEGLSKGAKRLYGGEVKASRALVDCLTPLLERLNNKLEDSIEANPGVWEGEVLEVGK